MSENRRVTLESIGLAAVVVSLVFVGLEIRQNTAATGSATQQAVYDAGIQLNLNVMNNERLRDLLVLTRNDPNWAATVPRDGDYLLVRRFYMLRFNNLENAYYHFLQGTYDARLWTGQHEYTNSIAGEPLMKHFWADFGAGYMPEFREYMDSTLAAQPGEGSSS